MCLTFLQHFMPLCVFLAQRKRLSLVYFISFSYHVFIDRSESNFIGKKQQHHSRSVFNALPTFVNCSALNWVFSLTMNNSSDAL